MKKIVLISIFLFCLSINTYQAINKNNCMSEIIPNDLNSKNLLTYIQENNLKDHIYRVCSKDICASLNASNLERSINNFIKENLAYLEHKNEEQALEASLKGFRIEKFIVYSC